MRVLADVNVSRRVVDRLRAAGFEVVRVPEILDARTPDIEILAEARQRGAVLISHDQDFGALLAASGERQPSLINLRVTALEVDPLAERIRAVLVAFAEELGAGVIVTIDDERLRLRPLPVG